MKALTDWLDHRTGYRKLLHEALFENVPGGARWRYVWGSTLTFCFAVQIVTGIFLWLAYSPGAQTAWESVYYIQHEVWGGWFLRGLHHYTAQAMTVLLAVHLMQVVIDGAYKAPREVNFWVGVVLMLFVLSLSLTGYLLPWDQKGYWATRVATNIAGITPVVGPALQQILIGGADYGHQTLTRFFALHAGVVPGVIIALIGLHIYLFRRHGLTPKEPRRKPDAAFWPDQVLCDAVACLAVMAVVVFLVVYYHGAELDAPADPSEPFSAARPEWYFLFLFQLLKYFPGGTELWGAIILPAALVLVLLTLPFWGRSRQGHRFNLAFLWVILGGAGVLTWLAWKEDQANPDYLLAVQHARRDAERVVALAQAPTGIPVTGAVSLLRDDPMTQGPRLFSRNCASCHRYGGDDGLGGQIKDAPSASDLKGFASREWLAGLLDPATVDSPHYFGGSKFKKSKMVDFVKDDIANFSPADRAQLGKTLIALSAEAGLKSQQAADRRDAVLITEGREQLIGEAMNCTTCHKFHEEDQNGDAPDLTGYGSRDWLVAFISNPAHARFYGASNDRMPAFGADQKLTAREIGLIADWLRGDWYEPAGK
ncbi:MAG TPA: cytochrome b N-terminal domain-containing protein [Opitutaceae bacterium]|nr:cytochrome b N-terminal domain-containing protein [Lacunisphaera sp.]HWA09374.1 cytochrome b N-terminal domain-containing protein [Opitutaceae bacterium]